MTVMHSLVISTDVTSSEKFLAISQRDHHHDDDYDRPGRGGLS